MIARDPEDARRRHFDVIVVGGGILGVCHALEAARRGLTVLLLEREDFGGAASWASQRILHGGLRYLQSLDLRRHRQSVRERRWFLRHFPEHTRPQPCVMPLYNRGLKRTSTMRAATWLNDALTHATGGHEIGRRPIPRGEMLSAQETLRWCPQVQPAGLRGGVLWYDGLLVAPQRVLMEILRWACHSGARACNYVRVTGIARHSTNAYAVQAFDSVAERHVTFLGTCVINAAGHAAAELDERAGPDASRVAPPLTLAFGVVLDRTASSQAGIAVSPMAERNTTFFVVPLQDKVLAGTCHLPAWAAGSDAAAATPTDEQLDQFLARLNCSLPGLDADRSTVIRTLSGLLPGERPGSRATASRPVRRLHASSVPESPFISVWTVKYTTARATAAGTLDMLVPRRRHRRLPQPAPVGGLNWSRWSMPPARSRADVAAALRRLQREESVQCLDDLVYRRTDWGTTSRTPAAIASDLESLLSR